MSTVHVHNNVKVFDSEIVRLEWEIRLPIKPDDNVDTLVEHAQSLSLWPDMADKIIALKRDGYSACATRPFHLESIQDGKAVMRHKIDFVR